MCVHCYVFLWLKDHLNAVMELSDENQQLLSQYEKEKQRRREVEEVRPCFLFLVVTVLASFGGRARFPLGKMGFVSASVTVVRELWLFVHVEIIRWYKSSGEALKFENSLGVEGAYL